MADSNAVFGVSLTYTGAGGTARTAPAQSVTCPYQALSEGTLDIADATAAATELAIPLGSIGTAVTGLMIKNASGQELLLEFNGGAENPCSVPSGGLLVLAFPSEPGDTPVTAMTVTTTAEQSGEGKVYFWAVGDPAGA